MLRITVLLGVAASLLPFASASGTLDAGPLVVVLDNGHAENCVEEASNLCLASFQSDGSEDVSGVDVRQNVRYLGVAVDDEEREFVEDATGVELLPDGSLVYVDARTLEVPNPTFRLLAENVGEQRGPLLLSEYGVFFTQEHYGFWYYGPDLANPNTTLGSHTWDRTFYSNGTNYDGFEGLYNQGESDAHHQVSSATLGACHLVEEECTADPSPINDIANSTPNVYYGSSIVEAQVAGSSQALVPTTALASRSVAGAVGERLSAALPDSKLPIRDQAPARLDVGSPTVGSHERPSSGPSLRAQPPVAPVAVQQVADASPKHGFPPALVVAVVGVSIAVLLGALYSRIRGREDLVLSPARVRMLDVLASRGPLSLSELSRELALDRKTIEHHARVLARESRVRIHHTNRVVYVTLPGQEAPAAPSRVELSPTCQRVLAILLAHGGTLNRVEVQSALSDIPQRTRNHALKVLVGEGLVEQALAPEGIVLTLKPSSA